MAEQKNKKRHGYSSPHGKQETTKATNSDLELRALKLRRLAIFQ
jgi:hypothetical protein